MESSHRREGMGSSPRQKDEGLSPRGKDVGLSPRGKDVKRIVCHEEPVADAGEAATGGRKVGVPVMVACSAPSLKD